MSQPSDSSEVCSRKKNLSNGRTANQQNSPRPVMNEHLAGVLQPVFAIRTSDDLGIGDTDGVRQLIDWCHRHDIRVLQILPINETGADHCPYKALSALAL